MEIFNQSLWNGQRLVATVLKAAVSRQRLFHAYLLGGRALEDKWQLSRQLACYLNCQGTDKVKGGSCAFKLRLWDISDLQQREQGDDTKRVVGSTASDAHRSVGSRTAREGVGGAETGALQHRKLCQNCAWIVSNQHPQAFVQLAGEETKSGKIAVEKARLLASELSKTSDYFRVVVIPDASEGILHRPAANALLKTIEEPPVNTVFILFADHVDDVLPTIVSRCQVLNLMNQPDRLSPMADFGPEAAKELELLIDSWPLTDAKSKRVWAGLQWAKSAQAICEETELPLAEIIDQVVAKEIKNLRDEAVKRPFFAAYLKDLLDLADKTKQQLDHYVSPKAASDYFALCLRKLRQDYFGSSVFGKG